MPAPVTKRANDYFAEELPFTGLTVTEITVPSGRLIVSDALHTVAHFDVDPEQSITDGAGMDAWSKLFAHRANTAHASIDGFDLWITRNAAGNVAVITPERDAATGEAQLYEEENAVARITTDFGAIMLTDYRNWLDHGGPDILNALDRFQIEDYRIFEVTPGRYKWTVYSHADGFEPHSTTGERITFACLERVKTYQGEPL